MNKERKIEAELENARRRVKIWNGRKVQAKEDLLSAEERDHIDDQYYRYVDKVGLLEVDLAKARNSARATERFDTLLDHIEGLPERIASRKLKWRRINPRATKPHGFGPWEPDDPYNVELKRVTASNAVAHRRKAQFLKAASEMEERKDWRNSDPAKADICAKELRYLASKISTGKSGAKKKLTALRPFIEMARIIERGLDAPLKSNQRAELVSALAWLNGYFIHPNTIYERLKKANAKRITE